VTATLLALVSVPSVREGYAPGNAEEGVDYVLDFDLRSAEPLIPATGVVELRGEFHHVVGRRRDLRARALYVDVRRADQDSLPAVTEEATPAPPEAPPEPELSIVEASGAALTLEV
jgi:hypothetical protein